MTTSIGISHPVYLKYHCNLLFLFKHNGAQGYLPHPLIPIEIHPTILAEVRIIDLSLSSAEVQELMLTELVQAECMELWVQHCLVKTDKQALQDKLYQEEVTQ